MERHDFDCVQMALNAGQAAMASGSNFGILSQFGSQDQLPNRRPKCAAWREAFRKRIGLCSIDFSAITWMRNRESPLNKYRRRSYRRRYKGKTMRWKVRVSA